MESSIAVFLSRQPACERLPTAPTSPAPRAEAGEPINRYQCFQPGAASTIPSPAQPPRANNHTHDSKQ